VEPLIELPDDGVVVLQCLQVSGCPRGERRALRNQGRDHRGEETEDETEGPYAHQGHRSPPAQSVPNEPRHGGLETDRDEQSQPDEHQRITREQDQFDASGDDCDARRSGHAGQERRSAADRLTRRSALARDGRADSLRLDDGSHVARVGLGNGLIVPGGPSCGARGGVRVGRRGHRLSCHSVNRISSRAPSCARGRNSQPGSGLGVVGRHRVPQPARSPRLLGADRPDSAHLPGRVWADVAGSWSR
jgi:hypothetical protein